MRHLLASLVVLLAAPGALAQPQVVLFPGLEGQPLLDAVRAAYAPTQVLGYDVARDSMFAWENRVYGDLTCVYTGFSIVLTPGADPSTDAFLRGINTEHTWPQSMGASVEPSRSDMHHLYPVKDNVNSARNNHPYAEIPDAETDTWYRLDQSQPTVPAVAIDEWSEKDDEHPSPPFAGRFEPREDHAGDAARAAFYYRALYPDRVSAAGSDEFFEAQRPDLLAWVYQDPVDAEEYARTQWVSSKQGAANPFVLDSTLARRAFRNRIDTGGGPPPAYPAIVWVNELHYDNASTDTGEFVELAVPMGVESASVEVVLYNGNGGLAYDTVSAAEFTPGAVAGGYRLYHRTWPTNSIQNGSPDGLSVSVDGEVVLFMSYEGVFTAADGPAEGLVSVDIGVAETGTTPAGSSLQLRGAGSAYADFVWAAPSAASPGAVNAGQTFDPVSTEPPATPPVASLVLHGPNPFRGQTALVLTLAAPAEVRVEAFDALGRRVAVLVEGPLGAGPHVLTLDGTALAPGLYVVRAFTGVESFSVRVVQVR